MLGVTAYHRQTDTNRFVRRQFFATSTAAYQFKLQLQLQLQIMESPDTLQGGFVENCRIHPAVPRPLVSIAHQQS
jgi:hypothetical protein